MARKLYVLKAVRRSTGKLTVGMLHVSLRAGAKGTGRIIASLYCFDTASDYRKTAWELADYAREQYGIEPGYILNYGPYPMSR